MSGGDRLRHPQRSAPGSARLAEDTGDCSLDNSNDFRPAFAGRTAISATTTCSAIRRSNGRFDGKFRTIRVKVKRPGVTVAARKGYFAVRDPARHAAERLGGAGARARSRRSRCPMPSRCAPPLPLPEPAVLAWSRSSSNCRTAPLHVRRPPTARATRPTSPSSCASSTATNQVVRKLSQHYEIRGELRADRAARSGVRSSSTANRSCPRRLLDRNGRARCAGQHGERPVRHGRSPAPRRRPAPRQQPAARHAAAKKCRKRRAEPATRCRATASRCSRTSRARCGGDARRPASTSPSTGRGRRGGRIHPAGAQRPADLAETPMAVKAATDRAIQQLGRLPLDSARPRHLRAPSDREAGAASLQTPS